MKTEEQRLLDELYDRESRTVRNEDYLLDRMNIHQKSQQALNYPDAKKHQLVSFIKSAIRILGYVAIPIDMALAAGILVVSEIVGIVEELV